MNPFAIIGIGSPFGQDTLGWRVIECLKHKALHLPDVDLIGFDRPGTLLLDYMKGKTRVILVDAIVGDKCGDIVCLDKYDILAHRFPSSSHQIGVAESLALGEVLDVLPEQLVLYGIKLGSGENPCDIAQDTIVRLSNIIIEAFYAMMQRDRCYDLQVD